MKKGHIIISSQVTGHTKSGEASLIVAFIFPQNIFSDEHSPLCGSSKRSYHETFGSAFIALGGVKVIDLAEWIRAAHGCTVDGF